uniref:MARVEL domain-containing protein n=1 Tax=Plectus sambesii TaxID=2011161 RepID=A0A914VDA7_9BILA
MAFSSPYGPVKIIPASAMRDNRLHFQAPPADPFAPAPINAAYYMSSGSYNPGFVSSFGGGGVGQTGGPYGANAYVDTAGVYPGGSYGPQYGPYGGGGGDVFTSGPINAPYSTRPPSPVRTQPYRRSRTAPARTFTRKVYPTRVRLRGYSADHAFDSRYYRSFSGPVKKPLPMYRKRREPARTYRYQETEFGAGTVGDAAPSLANFGFGFSQHGTLNRRYFYGGGPGYGEQSTLRRASAPRQYYSPSYTTYPPSTMHPRVRRPQDKYPTWWRVILKIAQLVVGATILGTVLGPMRGQTLYSFVTETRTEWQGAVVAIVAIFGILTLLALLTVFFAMRSAVWRQVDAFISALATFCYVIVACIESWYAACYPPLGGNIPELCHRLEWAIAAILTFVNLILYAIDLILAFRTGVSML